MKQLAWQLPPLQTSPPSPLQAVPSAKAVQPVRLDDGWQLWHGSVGFRAPDG
jgi:hypothetical protein